MKPVHFFCLELHHFIMLLYGVVRDIILHTILNSVFLSLVQSSFLTYCYERTSYGSCTES